MGRRPKYPFGNMGVGDRYLFSTDYSAELHQRAFSSVRSYLKMTSAGKEHWKFSSRKTSEGVVIIRVK